MSKAIKLKDNVYLSQDSIAIPICTSYMSSPTTYTLPQKMENYKYIDFVFSRGTDYGQDVCRVYYNGANSTGHANLWYTDSDSSTQFVSIKVSIIDKTVTFTAKNFSVFGHTVSLTNTQFGLIGIYGYK